MSKENFLEQTRKMGQERIDICKECPDFIKLTKQCKRCGCFMPAKVLMKFQKCPAGKW